MTKKIHLSFIVLMIILMFILFYVSLSYRSTPRLIPMILSLAGLLLLLLQLLIETSETVSKRLSFLQKEAALISFTQEEVYERKKDPSLESVIDKKWCQIFRIFFWLIGYLVLFYYIEILYSAILFIFLFSLLESRKKWTYALGISVGIGVFMFVIFGCLLRAF